MEESVGDSSRDLLANVQRAAREILKAALDKKLSSQKEHQPHIDGLPALRKERDKLIQEEITAKIDLELRERLSLEPLTDTSISDEVEHVDALRQKVKTLEEEVETIKTKANQNASVVKTLQEHDYLLQELFPPNKAHPSITSSPTPTTDNELVGDIDRQAGLVSELLTHTKQLEALRRDVIAARKERLQCQQRCRTLMENLESERQAVATESGEDISGEEEVQSLKSAVERGEKELSLFRHTLQALVGGSGIDWSQDEKLLELVIKLGTQSEWT